MVKMVLPLLKIDVKELIKADSITANIKPLKPDKWRKFDNLVVRIYFSNKILLGEKKVSSFQWKVAYYNNIVRTCCVPGR